MLDFLTSWSPGEDAEAPDEVYYSVLELSFEEADKDRNEDVDEDERPTYPDDDEEDVAVTLDDDSEVKDEFFVNERLTRMVESVLRTAAGVPEVLVLFEHESVEKCGVGLQSSY